MASDSVSYSYARKRELVMLSVQLALIIAALSTGAAGYISAVEHPARRELDDQGMIAQWKPAYKRGIAIQAPLAMIGSVLGLLAWWQSGNMLWLFGALLLLANWPYTFIMIMPTNRKIMVIDPTSAGLESRALIEKWARLHAVRSVLGLAAVLIFLWASLM